MLHIQRKPINRFYIKEVEISSPEKFKASFNIPYQYKYIRGVFVYGDVDSTLIEMKIAGTEILPANFDASLIEFKGFIARTHVVLPINMENQNYNVEVLITPRHYNISYPKVIKFYFIVQ